MRMAFHCWSVREFRVHQCKLFKINIITLAYQNCSFFRWRNSTWHVGSNQSWKKGQVMIDKFLEDIQIIPEKEPWERRAIVGKWESWRTLSRIHLAKKVLKLYTGIIKLKMYQKWHIYLVSVILFGNCDMQVVWHLWSSDNSQFSICYSKMFWDWEWCCFSWSSGKAKKTT